MNKHSLLIMATMSLLFACGTSPQEIDYGHVSCDFCKMTVVDQRYAAQLVTTKGKIFMFDAAECMINYMQAEENERHDYSHVLVSDYMTPTKLIDAHKATYLRSPQLPSPMGAYLTALSGIEQADELLKKHGGTMHDWKEVNQGLDKLPSVNNTND